ncbi:MAG TPA: adenylate/guanylate cyclase domain-containing protein, partial [Anaerolineales bacterium]|nr:adenylate/guanylate cyclase domain-containing protein [Anaerolineales bacterium]
MQNAVNILSSYLPHDRRKALALGESLPDRVQGAALFADISGFTPLTERLAEMLGARRGVEELSRHLNTVYDALISEVETWGGSVVSFAGDAIICWFSGEAAIKNAVACTFRMHQAMKAFFSLPLPDGTATTIAVKTSIAYGKARRFVVGDPLIQLHDVLAGETIDRMAAGEKLARKGETIVDEASATSLGNAIRLVEWREDPETHHRFAVVMPTQATRDFRPPEQAPEDTAPQSLQLEHLTPWLIPAISARLLAGQGEFLTELRPGVPVFVQFLGIDFESDEACPQLDQFVRQLQQILARYEGTMIDLTVGDKGSYLHASFGAITIHEDDTRRAVQAALEFQQVVAELPFLQQMQIGISRGTLRTGAYGGRSRRVYGALGDDVNLAARLMEAAHPGEIVVSGWVQKSLGERFEPVPRPPLHVKGKVDPISVFVVHRQRRESGIRLQEPHFELPMV